jgi:hypothetical protein
MSRGLFRFLYCSAVVLVFAGITLQPSPAIASVPHFHRGHARLVDVEALMRSHHLLQVTDMTVDGSRVAVIRPIGDTRSAVAGVLRVPGGHPQNLGRIPAFQRWGPQLSPRGFHVLYWGNYKLHSIDVMDGDRRIVARRVSRLGMWDWLPDGRIAYVTTHRRVALVRPGHRPVKTALRIAGVKGKKYLSSALLSAVAVAPDASRALYTDPNCTVWSVSLKTGHRYRVAARFTVPFRAWAPDATTFVLSRPPSYDRGQDCVREGSFRALFLFRNGALVGRVTRRDDLLNTGISSTWSPDSRWLLVAVQPTGTQVTGYRYLEAASVRDQTTTVVVPDRLASDAFMGPDQGVVFSRYRFAEGASLGHEDSRIVRGRLVDG